MALYIFSDRRRYKKKMQKEMRTCNSINAVCSYFLQYFLYIFNKKEYKEGCRGYEQDPSFCIDLSINLSIKFWKILFGFSFPFPSFLHVDFPYTDFLQIFYASQFSA